MASRPMIVMIGLGAVAALAVAGTALGAAAQDVTGGAGSPSPAVVASESGQETTSVPRTGTDGRPIWEVEVVADGRRVGPGHRSGDWRHRQGRPRRR
ncbi:hypothetical protein O7543_01320 [Solwaraspora sp. WMMA2080]|uniref:hypothetical protein n=1 Tax=unclassified Solwaraspora TaxID=2627926 RepID=UPI00248CF84D|nr:MULTISPECIES: hypothetical protein [unclassified Solwaraspora]WBB94944.1 hypothetical protein O7553_16055 [Solwaraspora sp. WMMA2059]WBC21173.1 hypothetical protein O7543_01320 [Solwaraspora sp. WMMA2080]